MFLLKISADNPEAQDLKIKLKKFEFERDLHRKKAETNYIRKRESRLKALREQNFEVIVFGYQKI